MACRTDDLVGEIEKLIESEPLAIPDPDASVAERVAEVLKHIVGRFAGLAPRARVRARSTCARGLREFPGIFIFPSTSRPRARTRGVC